MSEVDPLLVRRVQRLSVIAGICTAMLGAIVLAGWVGNIAALKSVLPGLATMKANTALGLLLCGLAVWLKAAAVEGGRWSRVAEGCGIAAVVVALLALAEYGLGVNLRVDELLFRDSATAVAAHPGRMSVATAGCILLAGAAAALLDRVIRLAQGLAILVVVFSLLAILGYAYGIQSLYRIAPYSSMAIHTASGLCLVSVGVLMARPRRCFHHLLTTNSNGGVLARRLLPATVMIPLVVGWATLLGRKAGYYDAEFGTALFALMSIVALASLVWWNASMLNKSDARRTRLEKDLADLLVRERAARERAEKALQTRQQLLNVVSHELRTPLNPILMLASAMEMDDTLPAALREPIETIRRQVQLEKRLIDDLLDWVSLGTGKLSLEIMPVDLHEVVRRVAGTFQERCSGQQTLLDVKLGATHFMVMGDEGRLQQILRNLLDNAVKFTPDGGTITVSTADEADGVVGLKVRDTGIGIKKEVFERLFGAFEQGDATITRKYGGLGIGLAVSRMLAESQKGTLTAASAGEGQGTTMALTLETCAPEAAIATPKKAEEGISQTTSKWRMLVVEDNPETLKAMAQLLRVLGHEVVLAQSASQALEAARLPFDVLISDIGLPDVSGWELMRQLSETRMIRGIAVSGFVTEEDRRRSLDVGFLCHLSKPISIAQLSAAIEQATGDLEIVGV